ncbi:hypothetical protein [Kitasatospora sp. NBC_01300]|uniref:hypothetical protein n=1 Tax=Kitasatospora sp. NBC_01300 TaxID=2903574 RepID=UPI00352E46FE|nr:hypothetical protein OG556_03845 [Kitasatospora sp. NBC_01300]
MVLPPLFDPSLEPELGPDDELIDVNAHFVARLAGTGAVAALAEDYDLGRRGGADPAEDRTRALFARAAAQVTARGGHAAGRLRAMGMALRLAGEADPALRLAADDVELVDGTTECGADVALAAQRTELLGPEARWTRAAAPDGRVHLVIETDQQLPAAAVLLKALGPARVVLCGRFATAHREALRALAPFSAAAGFDDWAPAWRLGKEWSGDGTPVRWVRRAADWPAGAPWAGWLAPDEAAALPAEAWRDCRGAALTVARLESWAEVTGADGRRTDLRSVLDAADGALFRVELLVGAPGVSAEETTGTARSLLSGPGPRLAGLSPFRLPTARGGTAPRAWGGVPLIRHPAPGHDLPRWDRFSGPGTLDETARTAAIGALNAELGAVADLFPGRFACCVLAAPDGAAVWEPSAAVVAGQGPGPDGRGPGSFVVNLRTGSAFRLHPKLTPVVERLSSGDTAVLDRIGDAARRKLTDRLVQAGVMRRSQ